MTLEEKLGQMLQVSDRTRVIDIAKYSLVGFICTEPPPPAPPPPSPLVRDSSQAGGDDAGGEAGADLGGGPNDLAPNILHCQDCLVGEIAQ